MPLTVAWRDFQYLRHLHQVGVDAAVRISLGHLAVDADISVGRSFLAYLSPRTVGTSPTKEIRRS